MRFESVKKSYNNPILSPDTVHWRSDRTFNPAAIYLNRKIHLLYRAVGNDRISRFGYANSSDGFCINEHSAESVYREPNEGKGFSQHSLEFGGSFSGCEDPRTVYIEEDDVVYITYTSCISNLRVALSSINKDDFLACRWQWRQPKYISAPNETHKNWVLFPEKINGNYAILHTLNPVSIEYVSDLEFNDSSYISSHYNPGKSKGDHWDSYIRGAGPPPIKTNHGWLLFYHAMHHSNMSRYKVGAMLLDLNDPTILLCRSHAPVLAPEESYETHGHKGGVVFATGAVVKNGTLLLYYGAADNHVCVAFADFKEFLEEMISNSITA